MIRFKSSGITALIVSVYQGGHRNRNSYADLYISNIEALPFIIGSSRVTCMTIAALNHTAEVISEQ
jgi:hypothetical protein